MSKRSDGDFNLETNPHRVVRERCRALVDRPWTLLAECHGVEVVDIAEPGGRFGAVGDIVTTSLAESVIGVWVGDCAPVALWSDTGRIAVAHAGWRGIAAGVLTEALAAVDGVTGSPRSDLSAFVGPTIGPCCYEFGEADLERVADAVGASRAEIAAVDANGSTSLDVVAAVRSALEGAGVVVTADGRCTGCDTDFHSYRRRSETGRHVLGVWRSG